jgi:thiol-disulfide isomerase/thioredoxin
MSEAVERPSSPARRWIVGLVAGAALAGGIVASLLHFSEREDSPSIPVAALTRLQALPFKDLNGNERTLADWKGKTLVINFWATWCPPCRKEMPAFSNLHTKLGGRGVFFIGIGIDSPSAIKEFALQYPVSYPLLIGGSEGLEAMKTIGNRNAALPYTLVLDSNGAPALSKLGMIDEATFEAKLLELVAAAGR